VNLQITLIGGPTALLEIDGLRVLTDPTFDPPGSEVSNGPVTLRKTAGPALNPDQVIPVDVILLSHDQHFDNLDSSGRAFLSRAATVLTTPAGSSRLLGHSVGLAPWQATAIHSADHRTRLVIIATPARHGPPGIEPISGEVTGFVIHTEGKPEAAVYITGDTVWYEGVAEVARRFPTIKAIVLFAGAARVKARGPDHLTMDTADAIATALAFPAAQILPVHHQGWEHFSESQQDLVNAFAARGLEARLLPLELGVPRSVSLD
jgi:L-ascorbate metabolism protein UlaG (beta-lactamase superfamily)